MSHEDDVRAVALKLLANGHTPLRLDPDSKAARHTGWQVETPTEESVERAFMRASNLGARCGDIHKDGTCLVGIDIDYEEPAIVYCVEQAIGSDALPRVPVKRGKKGKTYLFRITEQHKTTKIKWVRDGIKVDAIDVLCKGAQTVVPPSIHPDTKAPYEYISGPRLEDTDYRALPSFSLSILDEIRGFCLNADDPIFALNEMEWAGVGGGGNTHDTCVRAVSCMVGRQWKDADIQDRIQRAKREACERAGMRYDWPEANKVIGEWITSSRDKKFDTVSKAGRKKPEDSDVPPEMLENYVYVAQVDRMYSINNSMMLTKNVFDNIHAKELAKPWVTLVCHPDFRVVDRLTYSPGQPQLCMEKSFNSDAVNSCLNTYRPSGIEPHPGNVEIFVELVKHVFDQDEAAIDHVLSFLSHIVQYPGQRINHALVIQGDQGIGKDTILDAVAEVIGQHNYSQVAIGDVESDFNNWLLGRQLIVFQEMMGAGRKGLYNKLKTFITERVVSINEKHISLQRLPNRAAYVFLTNYKHAISIDHGDRRMWVWYSKAGPKSPEFFVRFKDWLADRRNVQALYHFLLEYDTSKFKPYAPPPLTAAKKELTKSSASEVEQFLREAIEAQMWPMGCDLINLGHLNSALRPFMRTSMAMIQGALDNLGCKPLDTRARIGSSRVALWAIRNLDKWETSSYRDLTKAYRVPLPPQQGETEGTYSVYSSADLSNDSMADEF